jgi:pimeloyl-ACP methyl ester carboxylesterase
MSTIKTNDGTEIYCKDWGEGQPIVFSHGWPLSADDWDTQTVAIPAKNKTGSSRKEKRSQALNFSTMTQGSWPEGRIPVLPRSKGNRIT